MSLFFPYVFTIPFFFSTRFISRFILLSLFYPSVIFFVSFISVLSSSHLSSLRFTLIISFHQRLVSQMASFLYLFDQNAICIYVPCACFIAQVMKLLLLTDVHHLLVLCFLVRFFLIWFCEWPSHSEIFISRASTQRGKVGPTRNAQVRFHGSSVSSDVAQMKFDQQRLVYTHNTRFN